MTDPDACDYTGTILKRLGVRYDYAMTGEEALMMLGDAEDQKDPYKLCMIVGKCRRWMESRLQNRFVRFLVMMRS